MRSLLKLTWVEAKLFLREPMTVVFSFAFPVITLLVMGGVFGNTPSPATFRGLGPMDYYEPAYLGLVMAAFGLISLPLHLVSYRERGVLRRLRASSVPVWKVFGSQIIVTFALVVLGSTLVALVTMAAYDVHLPQAVPQLAAAFVAGTLTFIALGVLLGAVLPTARAAQGAGMMLFFVMMMVSGTGPPREVLTSTMQRIGQVMPLWYVATILQDAWNGLGWNAAAFLIVAGITVAAALISVRVFRWE